MKKSIGTAALLGVICLALMPVAPAFAANWVYITTSKNGTDAYYDADTIVRGGNEVTVWEKWDHSRDKTFKERERRIRYKYDCVGRTNTILHSIIYYPDGTNRSVAFAVYEQETDPIAPGTIGESKLEAVCRLN